MYQTHEIMGKILKSKGKPRRKKKVFLEVKNHFKIIFEGFMLLGCVYGEINPWMQFFYEKPKLKPTPLKRAYFDLLKTFFNF